jgi:SAM-dependent methyltransferase
MDGQYLSHSSSYAYGSEEWPEFYDLWVESLFGTGPSEDIPVFRSALKRHVAGCNGVHTINVVDIGTGTGRVIKDLWQEPNGSLKEVSFWGLDNAQAMLDRAKLTFGVLEATHRSESSDRPARLPPIWIQAPAADFTSHLPELVGKTDLILFAAGGIGHLTADDEVIGFLTQVRQALRPPEHSELARAVISVLYEMIPEKNADLAVEQRRSGTGLPSGEALDDGYKIPSRDHTGVMYSKSPTVSQWSHDVRTDSFTIKIAKHREGQEGEVFKEKDVAWSLRIFDEKAFKDAVEKSGLRVEEVREGEMQRWYFLALDGA